MEKRTAVVAEDYVGWEEVCVSAEKGKREIHYYLKRKDGGSDLAVVGKEKSLRHMSYRLRLDLGSFSSLFVKFRSRREVVDCLHNFLPDSPTPVSPHTSGASIDGIDVDEFDVENLKDTQLWKPGYYTKEFHWLGSPWTCRKRRKHYQAFFRNGVEISVNQFVFVLAEEDKRLIAYLDDMYDDAKGNKMVVVQWFHKFDEVGIDLPQDFEDREIFFSLCHQDLSIECIDGLATVLSPQHYARFLKEVKHSQLKPFVCHRQYDNEDLKPLDITKLKGYWKQEIVRYMLPHSSLGTLEMCVSDGLLKKLDIGSVPEVKPRKRLRLSRDCKMDLQCTTVDNTVDGDGIIRQSNVGCLDQMGNDGVKVGLAQGAVTSLSEKDLNVGVSQCTAVGSLVEVLSQDSGMRGCWFRAVITKKRNNKVKLCYHDIKDAENEANCLEEWVVASRIAIRDEMGLRVYGRATVRPALLRDNGKVLSVINVGSSVDVWWHDGWWEGIVIQKEFEEKFRVYFPGEKREAVFDQSDLRHSQEWIGSTWKQMNDRPELVTSILSDLVKEGELVKLNNVKQPQNMVSECKQMEHNMSPPVAQECFHISRMGSESGKTHDSSVLDLSKDHSLLQLKWNSSHKRKRNGFLVQRLQPCGGNRTNPGRKGSRKGHQDLIPSALKIEKESCKSAKGDRDNCKYISDPLFGSSVVPTLTSLVMSR